MGRVSPGRGTGQQAIRWARARSHMMMWALGFAAGVAGSMNPVRAMCILPPLKYRIMSAAPEERWCPRLRAEHS